VNLPELSRDERAALAFLMRTAAKYGPEKCWPSIYSIGVDIGKKRRTVSTILTSLVAFGIVERIPRGPAKSKYRILLNSEQLNSIFCAAFKNDCAAYCAALTNSAKVKEIRLVKPRKSRAICVASPSLCPPTPRRSNHAMTMPEYYLTPDEHKLWRMAARWISENNPDLTGYPDRCAPIMGLLDRAGALTLPEDGPLPAIVWPPAATAEMQPARKPTASAGFVRELQRQKIGGEQ
jgi:hypothetical protein